MTDTINIYSILFGLCCLSCASPPAASLSLCLLPLWSSLCFVLFALSLSLPHSFSGYRIIAPRVRVDVSWTTRQRLASEVPVQQFIIEGGSTGGRISCETLLLQQNGTVLLWCELGPGRVFFLVGSGPEGMLTHGARACQGSWTRTYKHTCILLVTSPP